MLWSDITVQAGTPMTVPGEVSDFCHLGDALTGISHISFGPKYPRGERRQARGADSPLFLLHFPP